MTRGRKRHLNVARTPSGRKSRAASAQAEHIEPLAVRMRLFKLSEEESRDQRIETFVGRLAVKGERRKSDGLTAKQYDAALEYKRQSDAYRRALAAPSSFRNGSRSGGATERPDDEYANWCKAVIAKFEASQRAVMAEQCVLDNRGRNLIAALDYLVLRDEAYEHLVGDMRIGLNALARHYGLDGRRAS